MTDIYDAGTPGFNNGLTNKGGPLGWKGLNGAPFVVQDPRVRDTNGRQKMSIHQNIYDADFEYGTQPLRWEQFTYSTSGTATITHLPGLGGVQMQIYSNGDVTVRQSRPYHRYQPGKSLYVASNVNFGGPLAGQVQRVGIFDDGNGIFFEQAGPTTSNPSGMFVVIRSDSQSVNGAMPVDTRISYENWNGDPSIKSTIDWTKIQMVWLEFSWYGAGCLRWGVILNGEPYILHQYGSGNGINQATGLPQALPWSRTGNLPVRYEQRNVNVTAQTVFRHFGVSVLVEGTIDRQRGFTYSYGMSLSAPRRNIPAGSVRYPVMSFRMRQMGQSTAIAIARSTSTTTTYVTTGSPFQFTGTSNITAGITTFTTVTSGTVAVGQTVSGTGIQTGTVVTSVTGGIIGVSLPFTATNSGVTVTFLQNYAGKMLSYSTYPGATGSSILSSVTAASLSGLTGSIAASSNLATISGTGGSGVYIGMTLGTITGGTFASATNIITGQVSGTTGGDGTYTVSVPNTSTSTAGTFTTATGAELTLTFSAAHNLVVNDLLTLTGFSATTGTTNFNGIYPVVSVSGNSVVINLGYGINPTGTITLGTVTVQYTARISSNTNNVLTIQDVVTGNALPNGPTNIAGSTVGLIDRGQLLPQSLIISSDQVCIVELIASTPTAQVGLDGASFQALNTQGALYSFAERDVSATAMSGGEAVYAFTSPAGGSGLQQLDLSNFFPLLTNIKGNIPDILTVAITVAAGGTAPNIGVNVICQEAMS